jgi:GNAT superfamily N-acetyltransferase
MTPLIAIERKWKRLGVDLWITVEPDFIRLMVLSVAKKKRGRGLATRAMKDLARLADRKKKSVVLTPSINMGSNLHRLRKFYRGLGYKASGVKGEMVRERKNYGSRI